MEIDTGVIAYIDNYQDYNKTGNRFSLDKFVDKKLVSHLTARSITYDTTAVNKWTIKDYMIRNLDGLKETIVRGDKMDSIIPMEPADFMIMRNQQEMLTSPQLSAYIDKQKQRGIANIKEFEIEYHKRIAMSFASFILTVIGVSLSSRKTKGGMGLHLGIGLGLSFSYILFQTVASTFAVNGNMPPMIAMWIPNLLYALIAFYLYRKAPKNGLHLNSKGLKIRISACSCEIHKCGTEFFVVFISSFVSFPGSKSCWEPHSLLTL